MYIYIRPCSASTNHKHGLLYIISSQQINIKPVSDSVELSIVVPTGKVTVSVFRHSRTLFIFHSLLSYLVVSCNT